MCIVSTAEVSTDAQESLWVLLYTLCLVQGKASAGTLVTFWPLSAGFSYPESYLSGCTSKMRILLQSVP